MLSPSPTSIGLFYGLSEIGISLFKRSQGNGASADNGSLRMLWIVIITSISIAWAASYMVPQARLALLVTLYPLGLAFFIFGLVLRWYAIIYLGRFFTVDVAIAEDHKVIDSGPYRFIRHPSYTGVLVALLGFAITIGNWLALLIMVVPITAAFMRRIQIEEAALRAGLGENYVTYSARTKRLLPFIY